MQNEGAQIGIFLIQGGCAASFPVNVQKAAIVENEASQQLAKSSSRHLIKEKAHMKKLLAVLMAGLFSAGAFAQAPVAALAPAAATTLATPASTAVRTPVAKAPTKKVAHKKVAHKKAVHKKAHRHA